jgi:prepilin-type N-terminal cleavage/methylation domain-containing protein
MNPANTSAARAFTLMEMMLSLAIFAIVLAAINAVLFGGIRLRERTTALVQDALPMDNAVAVLKRDLAAILPPNTNNPDALIGAMSSDTTAPGMNQPVALEIFTASGVISDDKPWGDVQKIDYSLQTPTNRYNNAGRDRYQVFD